MIYVEGGLRLRATDSIVGIATKITMNKRVKSNSVRIIAGQWRGRRLPVLDSQGLRPTIDRVRETLFNWLMHECQGARALDLFAGTGALGLECLSRGATYVDFVERDRRVAQQINDNLQTLKALDRAKVWSMADSVFIRRQNTQSQPYDIVFLDPPFADSLLLVAIDALEKSGVLAASAFIYLEFAERQSIAGIPEHWQLYRQGKAGQSEFHLYQREESAC